MESLLAGMLYVHVPSKQGCTNPLEANTVELSASRVAKQKEGVVCMIEQLVCTAVWLEVEGGLRRRCLDEIA